MTIYTEVSINKHHAGFGMWQSGERQPSPTNSYAFYSDLIDAVSQEQNGVYPIASAITDPVFIAAGVEDIRGKIFNEPTYVFAYFDKYDELRYFGVDESGVPDDFFNR
jgi:hypothetical protein